MSTARLIDDFYEQWQDFSEQKLASFAYTSTWWLTRYLLRWRNRSSIMPHTYTANPLAYMHFRKNSYMLAGVGSLVILGNLFYETPESMSPIPSSHGLAFAELNENTEEKDDQADTYELDESDAVETQNEEESAATDEPDSDSRDETDSDSSEQSSQVSESTASIQEPPSRPASTANRYTYGYCTWHVAERRAQTGNPIPGLWGNATNWAHSARNDGYSVNDTPEPGSIAWRSSGYGHVAYVEEVAGEQIFVSEILDFGSGVVVENQYHRSAFDGYIH